MSNEDKKLGRTFIRNLIIAKVVIIVGVGVLVYVLL